MVLTVTICKGLPASGKSTWAKAMVLDNPGIYKRVNKDDLRAMLDSGHFTKANEKFVVELRDQIIRKALHNQKHVIVDDTNFAPIHTETITAIAKEFGATVIIKDSFLHVSLEECIRRDALRPNPVGAEVIQKMYDQYLRVPAPTPVYDPSLKDVIICDLDGTLALLNGRNPYDASTCADDLINVPVQEIINRFIYTHDEPEACGVIFVSGREEKYRAQTNEFLKKCNYAHRELFMRATGDTRKDYIIKREIYDTYIRGQYNVLFVLDDRNQTVKGWRDLGLTCLQVADGNF